MKCEKIELGITDITKAKFLNEHLVANINNNTITILDVIEAKVIKTIRDLPFQYISDILLVDNKLYIDSRYGYRFSNLQFRNKSIF